MLNSQTTPDECSTAIALGDAPVCNSTVFSNMDATDSNIGNNNTPDCFASAAPENDLWFSFVAVAGFENLTLTVEGVGNGPNTKAISAPQIVIYRGSCDQNGLNQVSCAVSTTGQNAIRANAMALTTGLTYFVRVSSADPGDFTLCIESFRDIVNMGNAAGSTACTGTIFDSGGPSGPYKNNENQTFTICPSQPHDCIVLDVAEFTIETADVLNVYAGSNTNGQLLSRLSGVSLGTPFTVQGSSECVTLEFISDRITTANGFEINWSCQESSCEGPSFSNPTMINALPFTQNSLSTCNSGSTFAASPCPNTPFISGPDHVFAYNAPGGFCVSVNVTNAAPGTGILVLDGLPDLPTTNCIASSKDGLLNSADLRSAGTYYIVVANALGCTDFGIEIKETECQLSPALVDALCNPINNCIDDQNLTFNIKIEDNFSDLILQPGLNNGCWVNTGTEPDFFWFTVQASQDGDLAFTLESAGLPSDLDFNVWGPFTEEQACNEPAQVVNYIRTNQPIRSSWFHEGTVTGLARIHPLSGITVRDNYDCGGTPSGQGDGFVLPVNMTSGEIYVVLVNDWEEGVGAQGININWSNSDPGVLSPVPTEIIQGDTAICEGESAQIIIHNGAGNLKWVGNTAGLSCLDCPNPIATPTETTTYTAQIDKACNTDTVSIEVAIFELNAGPDLEVCAGEDLQIVAGRAYENATYLWSIQNPNSQSLLEFSCMDCPDPIITAGTPANTTSIDILVALETDNCAFSDIVRLTIRPQAAPDFNIADDMEICSGGSVTIGSSQNNNSNNYIWRSVPAGFQSNAANPQVTPTITTTYYVSVTNASCGLPSADSVKITVVEPPVINVIEDVTICQGDAVVLGNVQPENGVIYSWAGGDGIISSSNPNTVAQPERTGTFTLTAQRGPCVVTESVTITVIPISAEITQGDSARVCMGSEITLNVAVEPNGVNALWTSNDGKINNVSGNALTIKPDKKTTYYATVNNMNCQVIDSIIVIVDSLPPDLAIMPEDTTVCEGSMVILKSPIFEPKDFPNITFQWGPSEAGFQTPDSLYNMVINPIETVQLFRETVNGACLDTTRAVINVDTIPDIRVTPADTTICFGASVPIQVSVNAPVEEIMWDPMTGLSCTDCLNPVASPAVTTTYNFMAKAGECTVEISNKINLTDLFRFPDNRRICIGDQIQLNDLDFIQAEYSWTSDDPDFIPTTTVAPIVQPTKTTTYFLTVTSDICGTVEAEITIEVLPIPEFQFPSNTIICEGESIELNSVETPGATYRWTATTPGFGQRTDARLTVSPTETTTYTLIITNGVCTPIQEQITIEVLKKPVLPTLGTITICPGESIPLLTGTTDPDLTYTWTSPDVPGFNSTNPRVIVSPGQTTRYTLTVSNANCDEVTGTVTVEVASNNVNLNISADPGNTIIAGEEVTISAQVTGGTSSDKFSWSDSNGSVVSILPSFTRSPQDTVTYTLSYTVGDSCSTIKDSITIFVIPLPDFKIPNAFTPNGDDENDFFMVEKVGNVQVVDFKIYNRWGQIVFDNDDLIQGWDGRYNGNDAPSDVYIYVIELSGVPDDDRIQKGDVTLIR